MKEMQWIVQWFVKNTNVPEEEVTSHLESNYFEHKWVDSFSFIQFISDIEENFHIRFDNSEFQDREFATIAGLSKILAEKVQNNEA
jgi:acyl carrier protein